MAEGAVAAHGLVLPAGPLTVSVPSLEARPGEVLGILGPNGAGKSTLLQTLAGLRPAAEGVVRSEGRVAFLPQRPVLFSGSVLRNVMLPLRLRGVSRGGAAASARSALAAFGVEHLASRQAPRLSGGEARRVALARVLAPDPGVLLLDEPFGGLDAPTRERLLAEAMGPLRAGGRCVVLVTHDREEAVSLVERVLVLVDGGVEQQGTTEEVFGRPASEKVAELVGAENVLFGRVLSVEREVLRVKLGVHEMEAVGDASWGDDVALTIRPEAIVLFEEEARGSARNRLEATVVSLERRPHVIRVVLDANGLRLLATVAPATVEEMGLRAGSAVAAAVKTTSVHAIRRGPGRPG